MLEKKISVILIYSAGYIAIERYKLYDDIVYVTRNVNEETLIWNEKEKEKKSTVHNYGSPVEYSRETLSKKNAYYIAIA